MRNKLNLLQLNKKNVHFYKFFCNNDLELLVNILKSIPTKHGTFQT
jgi:hypothetical protein